MRQLPLIRPWVIFVPLIFILTVSSQTVQTVVRRDVRYFYLTAETESVPNTGGETLVNKPWLWDERKIYDVDCEYPSILITLRWTASLDGGAKMVMTLSQ